MIKQRSTEDQWDEAWREAKKRYTVSEIFKLRDDTIRVIQSCYDDRTIYGFSGGKDSIVLRDVVERSVENPKFLTCELQNEYPSFKAWMKTHTPENTVWVLDESLSLEFIEENPSYLFPVTKKEEHTYTISFRRPVYKYMEDNGLNKFVTGKRFDDGNTCGRENEHGCCYTYMKASDMYTLNPLARWNYQQLLAYIQYFKLELPEIYRYPNGFVFGTHPWTDRDRVDESIDKTFDEIMGIDETIVPDAAKILTAAKDYMRNRG